MMRRELVLSSASPRRADLLRRIGLPFSVRPVALDESRRPGEHPGDMAERLARAKLGSSDGLPSPALVIAADTLVVIDDQVLGKPGDREQARRMVRSIAGRTHEVITAVAIRAWPEEEIACERSISRVEFSPLTPEQVEWYVETGEGRDKAGSYAVQGIGALFIAAIHGSYTNVIGLPLDLLCPHLRRWDFLP